MIQMVEQKTFTGPTMWWLDGHFQLEFDKKRQEESRNIVGNKIKKGKAEKAEKEIQEESSEDELSQFILARNETTNRWYQIIR